LLVHASTGILQFKGTDGSMLIRYTAVLTAFAQNYLGNLACIRMLMARSSIVLFMRSAPHSDETFREPSSLYGFPDPTELFESAITIFAPIIGVQALKLPT